jgi:hypothetical protein
MRRISVIYFGVVRLPTTAHVAELPLCCKRFCGLLLDIWNSWPPISGIFVHPNVDRGEWYPKGYLPRQIDGGKWIFRETRNVVDFASLDESRKEETVHSHPYLVIMYHIPETIVAEQLGIQDMYIVERLYNKYGSFTNKNLSHRIDRFYNRPMCSGIYYAIVQYLSHEHNKSYPMEAVEETYRKIQQKEFRVTSFTGGNYNVHLCVYNCSECPYISVNLASGSCPIQ